MSEQVSKDELRAEEARVEDETGVEEEKERGCMLNAICEFTVVRSVAKAGCNCKAKGWLPCD